MSFYFPSWLLSLLVVSALSSIQCFAAVGL